MVEKMRTERSGQRASERERERARERHAHTASADAHTHATSAIYRERALPSIDAHRYKLHTNWNAFISVILSHPKYRYSAFGVVGRRVFFLVAFVSRDENGRIRGEAAQRQRERAYRTRTRETLSNGDSMRANHATNDYIVRKHWQIENEENLANWAE